MAAVKVCLIIIANQRVGYFWMIGFFVSFINLIIGFGAHAVFALRHLASGRYVNPFYLLTEGPDYNYFRFVVLELI